MANTTIIFGAILIAIGLGGYLGAPAGSEKKDNTAAEAGDGSGSTDSKSSGAGSSNTALIPLIFGVPLVICGVMALNEARRKLAIHIAVGVGMLGALAGCGRFLMKVGGLFSNDPDLNRRALMFAGILGLVCLLYVILCVRSFVGARKKRPLETGSISN